LTPSVPHALIPDGVELGFDLAELPYLYGGSAAVSLVSIFASAVAARVCALTTSPKHASISLWWLA
jgi:hypothetical protein